MVYNWKFWLNRVLYFSGHALWLHISFSTLYLRCSCCCVNLSPIWVVEVHKENVLIPLVRSARDFSPRILPLEVVISGLAYLVVMPTGSKLLRGTGFLGALLCLCVLSLICMGVLKVVPSYFLLLPFQDLGFIFWALLGPLPSFSGCYPCLSGRFIPITIIIVHPYTMCSL